MQGGIYDQVAGGFHRYATDQRWLVPHFEKMLYNQAQLARIYVRAWNLTGNREYRRITEETLDYGLREMRSEQGAFYSATDADSEGEEGSYFVWDWSELEQLLNPSQLSLIRRVYGASETGYFEGHNILYLPQALDRTGTILPYSREGQVAELAAIKHQLYLQRQSRIPPLRDDKIITQWNGLMITALAEAGRLLDRPDYVVAAGQAASFVWANSDQGSLYRISLNGHSSIAATLEDYSAYLEAVLTLYDATAEPVWLERATALHHKMNQLFWNAKEGGFYNSQQRAGGSLIMRSQSATDGATSSGNSLALVGLVALNQRRQTPQLQTQIAQQLDRYSAELKNSPLALSTMLTGLAESKSPAPRALQYAGGGHVRVMAELDRGMLLITLTIENGWHVNAGDSGFDELIDIRLLVHSPRAGEIRYPAAEERALSFSDKPLKIYSGSVQIIAELAEDTKPLVASLRLQPCSETLCLQAETLRFVLR